MISAGGTDALLVRIDPEKGEARAAWRFGDTFSQEIAGLAPTGAPSSLYVLARTSGTIDLGSGPLPDHGAFVAGMTMDGPRPPTPRAPDTPKAPGADGGR
jgi:hypothetical protein